MRVDVISNDVKQNGIIRHLKLVLVHGTVVNRCEDFTCYVLCSRIQGYAPVRSRARPIKWSATVGLSCEYCDPPERKCNSIVSVNSHGFTISADCDLFTLSVEVIFDKLASNSVLKDFGSNFVSDSNKPVF